VVHLLEERVPVDELEQREAQVLRPGEPVPGAQRARRLLALDGRPRSFATNCDDLVAVAPGGVDAPVADRIGSVTARSTDATCASSRRILSKTSSDFGHIRSGFVSNDSSARLVHEARERVW
jgi:hypothetical protein